MKSVLLAILFFAFNLSYAQENQKCDYKVEGFIYDLSSKKPLPFATVQIKGSEKGAFADENGHFEITDICSQDFDLVFSFVGYKATTHHHDPYHPLPKIYLSPEELTLESVVIEGKSKIGDLNSGTVQKLSSKEVEINRSESIADLAGHLSGVNTLQTGQNVVKPVIHGLHSNRILMINNGVRHEYQSWGDDHAPEIDASLIESISVIKGAATVRYGPDALGGVLIIDPPKIELNSRWSGEVGLTGKSNGRSGETSLRLQKGYKKTGFLAEVSILKQGDLHTPDYNLSNTGKEEKSVALGGKFHFSNFDLNAYYSHFDQTLGILRGSVTESLVDLVTAMSKEPPAYTRSFEYSLNTPRQEVSHDLFKINGQLNGKKQSLELQYAFQVNHRQEFDVRRGTNNEVPAINLKLYSHTLDLDWKHPEVYSWTGSFGFQGTFQDNNNIVGTNTAHFVPNYNNTRAGIYLIESKEFNSLDFEWGIRYDYQFLSVIDYDPDKDLYQNNVDYQNITATAGIVKEIGEGKVFRSNIGSAWRAPSVSELYSFGKHESSIEYGLWRYKVDAEGNVTSPGQVLSEKERSVRPEKGIKWINSYELSRKKLQMELTGYANYILNYFYTRPAGITETVRGAFPFFLYDQTNALLAGLDVSAVYDFSKKISTKISGNYLWAKDIKNNDYFVGLPPANVNYSITYNADKFLLFDHSSLNLFFNYSFRQFQAPRVISPEEIWTADKAEENIFSVNDRSFDFMQPPPGYVVGDFVWTNQVNNFNIDFQIKNLFNQSYRAYTDRLRYFSDEIGRNFILSVKYKFQ